MAPYIAHPPMFIQQMTSRAGKSVPKIYPNLTGCILNLHIVKRKTKHLLSETLQNIQQKGTLEQSVIHYWGA